MVTTVPPPVPVGTSHDLKVGQKVFAIGNPFGLDWTLTTGIVSALDRTLDGGPGKPPIEHLIQTETKTHMDDAGKTKNAHGSFDCGEKMDFSRKGEGRKVACGSHDSSLVATTAPRCLRDGLTIPI